MSHPRTDLAELEIGELEAALESRGVERFHARQLYRWIYKRGVTDIDRMTDLSRADRETTQERVHHFHAQGSSPTTDPSTARASSSSSWPTAGESRRSSSPIRRR